MHPTQPDHHPLPLVEALRRISDEEKTRVCLAANLTVSNPAAKRLLDLFNSAIAEVKATPQLRQVMTHLVEDGDTWHRLPPEIQTAAMEQFLRLEAAAERDREK